mgnify:CR=1 FL=1
MNASNTNSITEKLKEIIKNNPNTIKSCVAQEALEHSYDDIKNFFSDLQQHGCVSGMISSLIYYVDTHKFYEKERTSDFQDTGKWKWDFDSGKFKVGYLSHTLHLLESIILESRNSVLNGEE